MIYLYIIYLFILLVIIVYVAWLNVKDSQEIVKIRERQLKHATRKYEQACKNLDAVDRIIKDIQNKRVYK